MLDADLASVYGVTTARLNQQVKRNQKRFPGDFAFQLTSAEYQGLMLQIATSKAERGGRRKLPYAFTEHGAIMASMVLNAERAVQMSVYVVRAFARMRALLGERQDWVRALRLFGEGTQRTHECARSSNRFNFTTDDGHNRSTCAA